MDKKKVKSANLLYLILGLISSVVFVVGIVLVTKSIIESGIYSIIPIIGIVFLILLLMSIVLLKAYSRRTEFFIYTLDKSNVVNFNELNKEYIQVKDVGNNLYFVKKYDYRLFVEYNLLQG